MKDIPGYEGLYAVTEDGRVWSYPKKWSTPNGGKRSHNGRWLKNFYRGSAKKKYAVVELYDQAYAVHRLVAQAFVPNPLNLPQVNHIDANRTNNHYLNLEWCDQQHNSRHAFEKGLMKQFYGEDHGGHKLSTEQVKEIRSKKAQGYTLKQLSEEYHSSISNISYICRKETRIYG